MKRKRNKRDINKILNGIKVDKDVDMRKAYDDAIKYESNKIPLEVREDKVYRVLVNNIRHEHTNYDKNLKNVYHIKNNAYYPIYKNKVLNQISNEYPYLSDECNRQLQGKLAIVVVK